MLEIINGDSFKVLENWNKGKVDVILTSPPYNTARRGNSEKSIKNHEARYVNMVEFRTAKDYADWVCDLFNLMDKVLEKDGVIIWNISYSSASSVSEFECVNSMWYSIAQVIEKTPFMVADKLVWKKYSALPNNVSPNKLTRICEDVFVFCRKDEYKTFKSNKQVKSVSKTGQKYYASISNFIEAPNNDGSNSLNKATFSTDFAKQCLEIYAQKGMTVLDPFVGTGTTLNACKELNLNGIGIEISEEQCEFAKNRLNLA